MGSPATQRPSVLQPGFRLDRYELLCILAQGGMASVWLARLQGKHGFEKLVAMKTILPSFAEDAQFQEMFLDEARIASGIDHPNVVHILDLGEHHGTLYLVMELIEGDPVSKLVRTVEKKGMQVPLGVSLKMMSDVCAGLGAVHALAGPEGAPLGVVHRDVSPQNVLVMGNGTAKLIDFGIAKARARVTGETSSSTLKGKVQYMAREQALAGEIDGRADLWAVGAMLYHLIAGRPPYKEATPIATLQALLNGGPIAPLPSWAPDPVRALLARALQHDPARRFQTGAEMQAAIDAAMIACNQLVSSAQLGAFVREHLAPRIDNRKKAIERALREAQKRQQASKALTSPLERTELATGSGVRSPDSSGAIPPSGVSSVSDLTTGDVGSSGPRPVGGALVRPAAASAPSFGAVPELAEPAPPRRGRGLLVAALALILVAAGIAGSFAVRHGKRASARDPRLSSATHAPPPAAGALGSVAAPGVTDPAPPATGAVAPKDAPTAAQAAPSAPPAVNVARKPVAPPPPPRTKKDEYGF